MFKQQKHSSPNFTLNYIHKIYIIFSFLFVTLPKYFNPLVQCEATSTFYEGYSSITNVTFLNILSKEKTQYICTDK